MVKSGGSVLKRLRNTLKEEGIMKQRTGKKSSKSTSVVSRKKDAPRDASNPFEYKLNRQKHEVIGRKIRGSVGKPGLSRKAGNEKTLLREIQQKDKVGVFQDRRFGEKDSNLTPEDRMMERFVREKKLRAEKSAIYNLDAEDEDLTHFGQSLSQMNDIAEHDPRLDDASDAEDGGISRNLVQDLHFGGFSGDSADGKKKSYQDIMKEVIAKSKFHKNERQKAKEENEQLRRDLNDDFEDIRTLIFEDETTTTIDATIKSNGADEYDVYIKELASEKRAKPTDRLLTEGEIAKLEAEKLEFLEQERQKNMKRSTNDSAVKPSADALDDGFDIDNDIEDAPLFYKDGKLVGNLPALTILREDDDIENSNNVSDESEVSELQTDHSGDSSDDSENESSVDHLSENEDEELQETVKDTVESGLPYVIPTPNTSGELRNLLSVYSLENQKIVFSRLATMLHPSIKPENSAHLERVFKYLLEYLFKSSDFSSSRVDAFFDDLVSLTATYPGTITNFCFDYLKVVDQKVQERVLQSIGKVNFIIIDERELVFIAICLRLYATSDFRHDIVTPLYLLISSILCKTAYHLNSLRKETQEFSSTRTNISTGIKICAVYLDSQDISMRFMPEMMEFFTAAFETCIVSSSEENTPVLRALTGTIQYFAQLYMKKEIDSSIPSSSSIPLSAVYLKPNTHEGWIWEEILYPFVEKCTMLKDLLPSAKEIVAEFLQHLETFRLEILNNRQQFASVSGIQCERPPLQWQKRGPQQMRESAPKFNEKYNLDRPRNRANNDQDKKFKALYKKEMKGAVRELRKDAHFLAAEGLKRRKESDRQYSSKINKIYGSLGNEAGAAKAEKARKRKKV